MASKHIETLLVHQNFEGDSENSVTRGIYPSTAFRFNNADHGADLFDLKTAGNIYTRLTNTTNDAFGSVVSSLEGGVGGVSFASGAAAIMAIFEVICKAGDHIVASSALYGGTSAMLTNVFDKYGVETTFVDQDAPYEKLAKAFRPTTKLLFAETLGNPLVQLLDFEKFSKLAKGHKVPLVLDATFTPPTLLKSKEVGADIIVHSASKYLGGHGNVLGGVVVDCGTFDWTDPKYPHFHTPDPAYHGIVYTEAFGSAALTYKLITQALRDMGGTQSPFDSYLFLQGLQTLHLRTKYVSESGLALAKWLETNPKIEWVSYPLLESSPYYAQATTYLPEGAGGIIAFGIKGDLEASKRFIDSLKLAIHAVNVGDTRTIVTHPASTTHRQVPNAEREAAGITNNLIRISLGLENLEDIKADLLEALKEV